MKKKQFVAVLWVLAAVSVGRAQTFTSGSNGSDGALNLTTPGTVVFNPAALGIDADGDNVFHFTTINIAAGVIVQMKNVPLRGRSVVWLASGAVQIAGTIDLNGQPGYAWSASATLRIPAEPGPGGYAGGLGQFGSSPALDGLGPGGGHGCGGGGGAAGHANSAFGCPSSPAYGNTVQTPLRGGSGGAGGGLQGGGGGAGGGAIRIASSASIAITGSVTANGGDGGGGPVSGYSGGGGGSGGGIHLLAPVVTGTGTLGALGGAGNVAGSVGRIRIDANQQQFTGTSNPQANFGTPYQAFLPVNVPSVRVTTIAGIAVSSTPTGTFTTPDVVINQHGPVTVAIEARNVPVGTVVKLFLFSEAGPDQTINSTALAGTLALSTATASATFAPGYSRGYVRATW